MKKYIVINGIFEGTIFNGVNFNGTSVNDRIVNLDSVGQSFPVENCIDLESYNKLKVIETYKNKT